MVLQTIGLTKLYKNNRGARDVSLALMPGDILGLLGPNGSGKTTVMKSCVGLLRPTGGGVAIEGHTVWSGGGSGRSAGKEYEDALRGVGALIEAPSLFDRMTARQNLRLAAAYYPDVTEERIGEVLDIVEMTPYADEKAGGYSLGMRQRLGLALALLNRPRLLVLDEPANGLDIEGMVAIRDIVKAAAAGGAAVLISSHLAHEIELCATHVGIMYDGAVLSLSSMEDILAASPSLEEFFLAELARYRKGGAAA
ncbi:MAG: ATP-binding cassette domain-containing protein [Oscillospiraceae bacterium]|nr:ATP-binding cassette domain-containing protein [Oscillospiraceae bacterium]